MTRSGTRILSTHSWPPFESDSFMMSLPLNVDTMYCLRHVLESQELAGVLSQLLSFSHSDLHGLSSRLLSPSSYPRSLPPFTGRTHCHLCLTPLLLLLDQGLVPLSPQSTFPHAGDTYQACPFSTLLVDAKQTYKVAFEFLLIL